MKSISTSVTLKYIRVSRIKAFRSLALRKKSHKKTLLSDLSNYYALFFVVTDTMMWSGVAFRRQLWTLSCRFRVPLVKIIETYSDPSGGLSMT